MEKTYNHLQNEKDIYKMWEELDLFSPETSQKLQKEANIPTTKETFCVLMPPPNANAPLHCGHATYAIQDIMARIKRMQGYKTLYLPGTDHAGFETQVVYERKLKKEGKSRFDFDRDTLFNNILAFVKENSETAINQLKQLGMSADWSKLTFMLDEHVIETVYDTFEKMHSDGLIYRDTYMVNYSTFHGTTFSNLETTHKETISPLYYVKYKIKDSKEAITVATVRPETIYADVAIAVNSKDSRYTNLVGKTAINPLNNRELPIITDSYVDMEFGTGALKITPGHDFNDYEIGKRHKLPIITVIDLEGKMTMEAGEVAGMYPKPARVKTAEILAEKGAIEKVDENYKNNLLVDYKDGQPIEPLPLPNWFLKMDKLAKEATKAVEKGKVKFYLPRWKKELLRWLKEIHDWPISRQIVFGIKIPVWYSVEENPELRVAFLDENGNSHDGKITDLLKEYDLVTIKTGLQKLIAPLGAKYTVSRTSPGENFIQETDTFDTWFSSGQWPLTTLKYPKGKDFKEFFPTSFMDTMWDILPFWVARMIMFSLYLTGKVPFENVYIHGAITDENGQKMSKSKGNVINPMEFVEKYGADALRMGIVVGGNTSAKETALSEDKVRGYRNFANKIWNMARFMEMMKAELENPLENAENIKKDSPLPTGEKLLKDTKKLIKEVNKNLDKYRLADAGNLIYQFMWHTLADEYIEEVKSKENKKDREAGLATLDYSYKTCLKLLHPFMPFVTEKIWQEMHNGKTAPLMFSEWPK
jgi:valyl-tRNA synthetase